LLLRFNLTPAPPPFSAMNSTPAASRAAWIAAMVSDLDLWIFQGAVPGPLVVDQEAVKSPNGPPPNPFTFSLGSGPVAKQTKGGVIQIADSHNFKASTTIAAALVTIHPGGMREMHWHPNAAEWQYYVKSSAQMTVFNTGPAAVTNNFTAGDIGYVKANYGHYVKTVGDIDLEFLEIFKTDW
jgi:oxalate decarboxylase